MRVIICKSVHDIACGAVQPKGSRYFEEGDKLPEIDDSWVGKKFAYKLMYALRNLESPLIAQVAITDDYADNAFAVRLAVVRKYNADKIIGVYWGKGLNSDLEGGDWISQIPFGKNSHYTRPFTVGFQEFKTSQLEWKRWVEVFRRIFNRQRRCIEEEIRALQSQLEPLLETYTQRGK